MEEIKYSFRVESKEEDGMEVVGQEQGWVGVFFGGYVKNLFFF